MPAAFIRHGRVCVLAVLLLLTGCSLPADLVVLRVDDEGNVGRAIVTQPGNVIDLTQANMTAAGSPARAEVLRDDQVARAFAGAMAAQPQEPTVWIVYFGVGSTDIIPESADILAGAVKAGQLKLFSDISVVGHADASGTAEQNRIISNARASRIRDALIGAGIAAGGIDFYAVGPDVPVSEDKLTKGPVSSRAVEITIR